MLSLTNCTGKVYVVHCVDTEGPLNESLIATFQRIKSLFNIDLKPTNENLKKLQNKQLDLNGLEDSVSLAFSNRIMAYNKDWSYLDKMLDNLTSNRFRNEHSDSYGNGWKYTWFIMDHIHYVDNPRSKITGYNAIWDHYKEYYELHDIFDDEFQWHVHPANPYNAGNHCGTSYWNSPNVLQSLCHRLIDRGFFPSCFRPGYHTERADSHWFLEQYIPYDFSNQAVSLTNEESKQLDLTEGRFGDWRRAKCEWGWYHPSHDDYQTEGNCHRYIFRCLNVGTRLRLITQDEVDNAFKITENGNDVILAFCDHDFREMKYDVDEVYSYIKNAADKFPNVNWVNSTAFEAAKSVLNESADELVLHIESIDLLNNRKKIIIRTNIDSFGVQPFFAIKLKNGLYRAEQLDIQIPNRSWSYVFDDESIRSSDVELIGVATNSRVGSGALKVLSINNDILFDKKW